MKIAVIGASAGIGLATVALALEKGHQVTAFSRNTSNIPEHSFLVKIEGDARISADLKNAASGADAILVTIGTKQKKKTTLFTETAQALIEAMRESDSKVPVLIVTGFGAGESAFYLNFFMRTVINLFLKDQYENKTGMEELVKNSTLKWEIVRPGMLTNDPLKRGYKVFPKLIEGMKIRKISRLAVADFLVSQAENPSYLYQAVSLGGEI